MIPVPSNEKEILDLANELIEACKVSQGSRGAYYRLMNVMAETGRYDGTKSLLNKMYRDLDRTASHIFSPVELKFALDFENPILPRMQKMAQQVGHILTREWDRTKTDKLFARGVFDSLKYGIAILKQWCETTGEAPDEHTTYERKLVMPWQFGVYREDENDINKQEALLETSTLTMPEVWKRIWHMPNAERLFRQIKTHAQKGESGVSEPSSYFHQVLSTSQLQTGVQGATRPLPGGIVQIGNDPNYAIMGPVVMADTVQFHELWVKDTRDYTTIQLVEPDILIAPRGKKQNLLIKDSKLQPYRVIQPNEVTNWFWGRSELADLIEPQSFLSDLCGDTKRLMGLQVDRILGFSGDTTMQDENYAAARYAGYFNLGQGGKVEDLTPKVPPELLPLLKWLLEKIDKLGGFPAAMQGEGTPGVRSQAHASGLQKMASPTLRDRALVVEGQSAEAAELTLQLKEAKDPSRYWYDGTSIATIEESSFLLTDISENWRVTVDSHSSSPIFTDENTQLEFAALKAGVVQAEHVIDNTPIPHKETAKTQNKAHEEAQEKLFKEHPELLVEKFKHSGGHK